MIRWWLVLTSLLTMRRNERALERRLHTYVGPPRPLGRATSLR